MERRRFLKRLHGELEEADENKKAKSASEPDPVIPLACMSASTTQMCLCV